MHKDYLLANIQLLPHEVYRKLTYKVLTLDMCLFNLKATYIWDMSVCLHLVQF